MKKESDADLHRLILNSFATDNIGLLYGKIGYALTFYILSGKFEPSKSLVLKRYGDDILNDVLASIPHGFQISFAHGICGIGWGLEFLIRNHYVEGNSYSICEDLDKEIMLVNPERLDDSLHYGLKGMLHYVLIHLMNCFQQQTKEPFDNIFLQDLYQASCKRIDNTTDTDLKKLCVLYKNYIEHKHIDYHHGIEICYAYEKDNTKIYKNSLSLTDGLCRRLLFKYQ